MDNQGFDRRRSRAIGQRRDLILKARLTVHPCRKKNLLSAIELEREDPALRYKILSRHLSRILGRREARFLGVVPNFDGCGPPEAVYGVERVQQDWLRHETICTAVFDALGFPPALRGYQVPPIEVKTGKKTFTVRPDAVWLRPGSKDRLVEIDMATEGKNEIVRKVEAYKERDQAILFVTVTDARLRKLMRWTKGLKTAFFALWQDIVRQPWGPVWWSDAGTQVALSP